MNFYHMHECFWYCHSWQRVSNLPILWRPPLYCLLPLFKILLNPCPITSNLHPHCSFCCLVFFGWMGDCMTFDVLFYLLLWIYTCWALVPHYQEEFDVFYVTRHQFYWGLTHVFFVFLVVLWFDITHKHTHIHTYIDKQYTHRPIDWHTHINIH